MATAIPGLKYVTPTKALVTVLSVKPDLIITKVSGANFSFIAATNPADFATYTPLFDPATPTLTLN